MKKILLIALASTVFASCACQGWSCKKRYVEQQPKTNQQKAVA
ncbi:hypothetical protein [Flavobacterium longum]